MSQRWVYDNVCCKEGHDLVTIIVKELVDPNLKVIVPQRSPIMCKRCGFTLDEIKKRTAPRDRKPRKSREVIRHGRTAESGSPEPGSQDSPSE